MWSQKPTLSLQDIKQALCKDKQIEIDVLRREVFSFVLLFITVTPYKWSQ